MGLSNMEIERDYRTNFEYYPWDEVNHYSRTTLTAPINETLFINSK